MLTSAYSDLMSHVEEYLREHDLNPKSFKCIDPDHDDSSPSSHVYKRKFIKCFGCNKVFTIFDAAHYLEGLPKKGSPEFYEHNVLALAKRYGVSMPSWNSSARLKIYSKIVELSEVIELDKRFEKFNSICPVAVNTPSASELTRILAEDFSLMDIRMAGVKEENFPKEDTISFPLWLAPGVCVGFMTRNPNWHQDSQESKYSNTYNNDVFTKGEYLYGIHLSPQNNKPIWIVEGQKDCLSIWAEGSQAVATSTSNITDEQISSLCVRGFSEVILSLDPDEAGEKGMATAVDKFLEKGILVKIAKFPNDQDPNDYLKENKLDTVPLQSGIAFITERLLKEENELFVIKQVIDICTKIEANVIRDKVIKSFSEALDVDFNSLRDDVTNNIVLQKELKESQVMSIFDTAMKKSKNSPNSALSEFRNAVDIATKVSAKDSHFNNNFFVGLLNKVQAGDADDSVNDIKFRTNGLEFLYKKLNTDGIGFTKGKLMCFGGDPHTGKSLTLIQLCPETLLAGDDTMVIYFSTDDTIRTLLPRVISATVFDPRFFIADSLKTDLMGAKKFLRDNAVSKINEWANSERLVMKDMSFSPNLSSLVNLVKFYRDKYPHRRILVINDNFHRNKDYPDKDKNTRVEHMAGDAKHLAVEEEISFWCAVEYRKNKATQTRKTAHSLMPGNSDIAGDRALIYHADLIVNIHNDLNDQNNVIENCLFVHTYDGKLYPRVNVTISKNKVSGKSGLVPMNMFPYSSFISHVDPEVAKAELEQRTQYLIECGILEDPNAKSNWRR